MPPWMALTVHHHGSHWNNSTTTACIALISATCICILTLYIPLWTSTTSRLTVIFFVKYCISRTIGSISCSNVMTLVIILCFTLNNHQFFFLSSISRLKGSRVLSYWCKRQHFPRSLSSLPRPWATQLWLAAVCGYSGDILTPILTPICCEYEFPSCQIFHIVPGTKTEHSERESE